MIDLLNRHCQHYGKETAPLSDTEIQVLLNDVSNWLLSDDNKFISKGFKFKNYYQTIAFVNASAWISHREDHHPDLEVGYNRCTVIFSTHSVGGLSHNDFICAAKFDALTPNDDSAA